MRSLILLSFTCVALTACADLPVTGDDGAADIQGEDKLDGGPGIEVTARLRPGTVDAVLTTDVPRLGYVFYAGENSKVTLEVTHGGSDAGLDTLLKV